MSVKQRNLLYAAIFVRISQGAIIVLVTMDTSLQMIENARLMVGVLSVKIYPIAKFRNHKCFISWDRIYNTLMKLFIFSMIFNNKEYKNSIPGQHTFTINN